MNTDTNRQQWGQYWGGAKSKGAELREVGHHTRHFSNGFIGAPIGQSKAFANSGKFCRGMFTLQKLFIIDFLIKNRAQIEETINTNTSTRPETYSEN